MILKIGRAELLSALLFAGQGKTSRPVLDAVCFCEDGKVLATNGMVAFFSDHLSDNFSGDSLSFVIGKPPVSKFAYATIDTDNDTVVNFHDQRGNIVGITNCRVENDEFPEHSLRRLREGFKESSMSSVSYNVDFLDVVRKVVKLFDPSFKMITLKTGGVSCASLVTFGNANSKGEALIMPMNPKAHA